MAPNLSLIVFLFLLLPAVATVAAPAPSPSGKAAAPAPSPSGNAAFNVTEILAPYPELKLFNMLLSKMLLAGEINSRGSITILATNNLCVEWLLRRTARLPRTSVADIVSFHVVLDYIDAARLAALPRGAQPAVFATLYQTTGRARNRTGLVNITAEPRDVVFAPATPGSRVKAMFRAAVTTKPYKISVLEVSNFIAATAVPVAITVSIAITVAVAIAGCAKKDEAHGDRAEPCANDAAATEHTSAGAGAVAWSCGEGDEVVDWCGRGDVARGGAEEAPMKKERGARVGSMVVNGPVYGSRPRPEEDDDRFFLRERKMMIEGESRLGMVESWAGQEKELGRERRPVGPRREGKVWARKGMAPNLSLLVFLFLLLPTASNAAATAPPTPSPSGNGSAFNVTAILARYPEFKLFNLLLSKTQVAREINSRNSITVLATNNAAVDWLLRRSSKLSRTSLAELMSVHVILDYIDAAKLAALPRGGQPAVATTLFQTTGTARNRTGFLNITAAPRGGAAVFVSAAPGSLVSATFKRVVTAKPYNISVLQISNFVVPPHIVTRPLPPSPPAPRMRQMAIAPSPAPTVAQFPTTQPSPQGDTSEAPEAEAPAPSHGGHVGKATMDQFRMLHGGVSWPILDPGPSELGTRPRPSFDWPGVGGQGRPAAKSY
ncbi:hypothetical protein HU200_042899 [Digitaria exilis]|uniref:FAS1 domain-containing protein n=1 Tax=Digitaria exilis TaxID=1010633 RepID=A0A835EHR8_9POAL|nr:hypothetical protein HU200_042899 [Digitaria exilis]CAB3471053.1 unnamed protein product [Digitaria exilis]